MQFKTGDGQRGANVPCNSPRLCSAVLATWYPELHAYYQTNFEKVLAHDPSLVRNYESSIFAAAVNFDPRTVCYKHTDPANLRRCVDLIFYSKVDYFPPNDRNLRPPEYQADRFMKFKQHVLNLLNTFTNSASALSSFTTSFMLQYLLPTVQTFKSLCDYGLVNHQKIGVLVKEPTNKGDLFLAASLMTECFYHLTRTAPSDIPWDARTEYYKLFSEWAKQKAAIQYHLSEEPFDAEKGFKQLNLAASLVEQLAWFKEYAYKAQMEREGL